MSQPSSLRVLCVTGIFPPDIGGPAVYLPQVCEALSARGHRVTVVTLGQRLTCDPHRHPFRVIRLSRGMLRPRRWWQTIATLVLLGQEADVFFVHGLALEAVLANAVVNRPLVHKVVGDLAWERARTLGWVDESFEDFQERRHSPRVEALKALRAWWTRRAVKVIVPSAFLSRWVAHWGVPEERLVVIHNVAHVPVVLPAVEVPLPRSTRIAVVGRLVPWKHVDGVLRVVAQVEEASLVIVGDGPERGVLGDLAASLGIGDRVYFAGPRSHAETLALMAACDLFVLNSSYEGLPHVVLEAMCIGRPVIATAAGGTPELVRHEENGLLVASGDSGSLKDAIARLVASPTERRRLGEGGRRAASWFSLPMLIDRTERVLYDAVSERACR